MFALTILMILKEHPILTGLFLALLMIGVPLQELLGEIAFNYQFINLFFQNIIFYFSVIFFITVEQTIFLESVSTE